MNNGHDHNSDIVYYNASIRNNENFLIPITINDIRSESIIENPMDWEMSVVRFNISSHTIPVTTIQMLPFAQEGIPSPSILTFTLRFNSIDYQGNVLLDTFRPNTGVALINQATSLLDAMNDCIALLFSSIVGAPSVTFPPQFVYDPLTEIISMYYEENYVLVGDVELFSSLQTNDYLTTLPIEFLGFNQPNGKDVKYLYNTGSSKIAPNKISGIRTGFPYLTNQIPDPMFYVSQEAMVMSSWSNIINIYLTTQNIPIISEYIPASINSTNVNFSSSFQNIISDFVLSPSANPIQDRVKIEYLPTAEYRMISLRGLEPLRRIQIQAWYTIENGDALPILLRPGAFFSCKLMFRKKRHLEKNF